MAVCYTDSSALVKRYVDEPGSAWVLDLFDPVVDTECFIAAITPVEVIAAIARRARGGSIAPEDATGACQLFRSDLYSDYQIVELTDTVLNRAMDLAEEHGLRGYDAVQLAAALEINSLSVEVGQSPILFISADSHLNAAACLEGLPFENPNDHARDGR